jgi:hypothetical protein
LQIQPLLRQLPEFICLNLSHTIYNDHQKFVDPKKFLHSYNYA